MEIRYRLESITETEFKINYDFDYSTIVPDKVKAQIGHDVKPIMEEDRVIVKAVATLVYGDEETELAKNSIALSFGLNPIKDVIVPKEDGTFSTVDPLILDTFLLATIGALRGVLMKNLKGTPLEPYYLPLIPIEPFKVKTRTKKIADPR